MQIYWPSVLGGFTVVLVVASVVAYYCLWYRRGQYNTGSGGTNGGDYVKVSPLEPPPPPMPNAAATAASAASTTSAVAGAMGSVVVPLSLKSKEGLEFIIGSEM